MLGEEIAVLRRAESGEDDMGEAVYKWVSETVEGCLVKPSGGSDAAQDGRPEAVGAAFSVALPKAYTEDKPLGYFDHAHVALVSRGMDAEDPDAAFRVLGAPMRTSPCPTAWDTVLTCGRTDG